MGDAPSASSSIFIALCGGVAIVAAAVGYIAERIAPVDKTVEPVVPEPPTLEERVENIEKSVGAVPVMLTPDKLSLPPPAPPTNPTPPPSAPPPMLGGARPLDGTPVKIRIVG